jgi:hypothetical protein
MAVPLSHLLTLTTSPDIDCGAAGTSLLLPLATCAACICNQTMSCHVSLCGALRTAWSTGFLLIAALPSHSSLWTGDFQVHSQCVAMPLTQCCSACTHACTIIAHIFPDMPHRCTCTHRSCRCECGDTSDKRQVVDSGIARAEGQESSQRKHHRRCQRSRAATPPHDCYKKQHTASATT